MACPAPPPFAPSDARCAGASGGSINNGTNIILWTCNNATQSHDQGWHRVFTNYDANSHACYYFQNELGWEAGFYEQVIGVSGGVMQNQQPVILWGRFASGHPDQIWCQY